MGSAWLWLMPSWGCPGGVRISLAIAWSRSGRNCYVRQTGGLAAASGVEKCQTGGRGGTGGGAGRAARGQGREGGAKGQGKAGRRGWGKRNGGSGGWRCGSGTSWRQVPGVQEGRQGSTGALLNAVFALNGCMINSKFVTCRPTRVEKCAARGPSSLSVHYVSRRCVWCPWPRWWWRCQRGRK